MLRTDLAQCLELDIKYISPSLNLEFTHYCSNFGRTVLRGISTKTAVISLLDEGIVKVDGKEDVHIELADMNENYRVFKKLIKDKSAPFLINFGINASISPEARENFADEHRSQIKKAEALVVKQLHHRLIAMSHIKYLKPKIPTMIFDSEEDARQWLTQFA